MEHIMNISMRIKYKLFFSIFILLGSFLISTSTAFAYTKVDAGEHTTCAIDTDQKVYCWGDNWGGQLGTGSLGGHTTERTSAVVGLTGVIDIAVGGTSNYTGGHACAVKNDGTVWCWGNDDNGLLGNGTYANEPAFSSTPVQVVGVTNAIKVSADIDHTCALKSTGTVVCWGDNAVGQMGNGTTTGLGQNSPVAVSNLADVVQISAGLGFTCAVKDNGSVWCWGAATYGRMGTGSTNPAPQLVPVQASISSVVEVSTGDSHVCAVRSDQSLWCWGNGANGRLGNGFTTTQYSPVLVSSLTGVTSVSLGYFHSCAVKTDETAWCWGHGTYGQLGRGTFTHSYTPVEVELPGVTHISGGRGYTCALRGGINIFCWGEGYKGKLGIDNISNRSLPGGIDSILAISAGGNHSCAVKSTNEAFCWGRNQYGQLGNDTTIEQHKPVKVHNLSNVIAVEAGDYHSCALKGDQTVWCWGSNGSSGKLGIGSSVSGSISDVPVQVNSLTGVTKIAVGSSHTCAVKSDGTVWCWGYGAYGELGNGDDNSESAPVQVLNLNNAQDVTAGVRGTCALTTVGEVWCWGRAKFGQIGSGTWVNEVTFPIRVKTNSSTVLTNVASISSGPGSSHRCAVKNDGTAWCWGSGNYGRLGNGTHYNKAYATQVSNLTNVTEIATGSTHTCAIESNGSSWCWGRGTSGQAGYPTGYTSILTPRLVTDGDDFLAISAAGSRSCALREFLGYCWGAGSYGGLGYGGTSNKDIPEPIFAF